MTWVLVTGGAKGVGKEICTHLARQGKNLVIHYRSSKKEAEALAQDLRRMGIRAETIQGDFSTLEGVQTCISLYLAAFQDTEALVNNVGPYLVASALKTAPDALQELFQLHVTAPLALIQALLPSLKNAKGKIINMGMVGCSFPLANTYATGYNMAKLALCMLTKSLAKELASSHVSVNMVSPGYLEGSQDVPSSLPMGRPVSFEEIARLIAFLLEPKNSHITGQNIEVAGAVRL